MRTRGTTVMAAVQDRMVAGIQRELYDAVNFR